ncbi:MAG: bacterioferritin [Rickettsiales bacterium]
MAKSNVVVEQLNIILKNELTAINQYFLHSRILRHQGYFKLAEKQYEESIDEMKHADKLTQRILMIGGLPNFQDVGRLMIGEHVEEMLQSDLNMEYKAKKDLLAAHVIVGEAHDPTSTNIIEDILASEEKHIEWLEAQLAQIKAYGAQNFLQSQV